MPWFKVDDKMHSHRKTRKLLRSHKEKRRDVAPLGLWAAAGSWCSDNLTDGFVPADELETWDDDAPALAARLVEAGLWLEDTVDGDTGFRFNDWSIRNPDAASVLAKRAAESEGGRLGNHVRWHQKEGVVVPDCEFCTTSESSGTRSGTRSGRRGGTRVGGESSRPVPARPTAAAAAEGAAAAAVDHLVPGPIAVLQSKLRAHTPLRGLRFDTLTSEQTSQLLGLVEVHGDAPLVDVAIATCRNPAPTHVSAFLGTWAALPPPGRPLHVVRKRYCDTHNTELSPAGVCSSCVVDQRVGDR